MGTPTKSLVIVLAMISFSLISPLSALATTPNFFIYNNDFGQNKNGPYSVSQLKADWNKPAWENGVADGRVSITSNALKVSYPKAKYGTADTGAQWKYNFAGQEEAFISYRLKFEPGFDFVKGGKLPGLAGGTANTGAHVPNGQDGFSARMMWRKDGQIVQYLYYPEQTGEFGQDFAWKINGKTVNFVPGRWYTVSTRLVMNEPGKHNGVLQSWLDGQLALDINNLRFRDTKNLKIDVMYFSTFFGGGDNSWSATKNEYAYFDDFKISTSANLPLPAQNNAPAAPAAPQNPSAPAPNQPQQTQQNLQVKVIKDNTWKGGYCATVEVYNPNNTANNWKVSFNIEGKVKSLWSAQYSQSGQTVTAEGLSWNNLIKPKDKIKFGFCADIK